MSRKFILFTVFILCTGFAGEIYAQNAEQTTQQLITALGKTKHKKKEKKNFSFETYIDVKSEAVVKNNAADYTGIYESSDAGYRLELRVSPDGRAEGNGFATDYRNSERQNFTLRDGKIEGALLTGTLVYANGTTERLEAVFNNRTTVEGKNPNEIENRETKYGLGFIKSYADSTNRVFLEFKR